MAGRRWTQDEVEFLKENYTKLGAKECANLLGLSRGRVAWKANSLGLFVSPETIGRNITHRQQGRTHSEYTKALISKKKKGSPAPNKIPKKVLIQELLNLAYVLDYSPRTVDVEKLSKFSVRPFYKEFGSWEKAMAAAGLPPAPRAQRSNQFAPVPCKACGTIIEKPKNSNHFFCSIECTGKYYSGEFNARWSGGKIPYYGPNWRSQRCKARRRDNYTCQHCGITEDELGKELDVHHIKPFKEIGLAKYKMANRLSNLISLCPRCHRSVEPVLTGEPIFTAISEPRHGRFWTEFEQQFLRDNYCQLGPTECAKKLNRPINGTYAQASKLGLQLTPAQQGALRKKMNMQRQVGLHQKACNLYLQGATVADIAIELSASKYQVRRMLKEQGVYDPGRDRNGRRHSGKRVT